VPGISIHVIDVSRGVPAAGMHVQVFRVTSGARTSISKGAINAHGHYDDVALTTQVLEAGRYAALFEVGAFYRHAGIAVSAPPFLDAVDFEFGLAEPAQHYHLPLKMTPWGYSLFRGGS
jgi:hydroxyisourate hydrolase